jgi:hypothetical protein
VRNLSFKRFEEVDMTRQTLVMSAVLAMLAGCGGGSQQQTAPPVTNASAAVKAMVPVPTAIAPTSVHPDRSKSWISPDVAGAPRLLFIADYGTDAVDIFTMPGLSLKGTITGFTSPEGECSDGNGNIWIANAGASELLLYSRTGTLLRTLSVPDEFPASCAYNKSTGDLAVGDIESSTGGPGNVEIFKNATGTGTPYTNSSIYLYFFVGWDNNGNLFFDGTNEGKTASYLAELPSGSSSTTLLTISGGTLYLSGFIQWYNVGNYLALGDQECGGAAAACIYWVTVSGSTATITATTTLSNYEGGAVCDLAQGVIAANGERYVAGADYESCDYTPITANRWPYEAGGTPTNYNNTATFSFPIGAAVSTKVSSSGGVSRSGR